MKRAKKLIAFLLAAVMVMSMSMTVLADEQTGSITITNPIEGTTYSVYRILELESYVEGKAYSYKVAEGWEAFLKSQNLLIEIDDETGYVTWIGKDDEDIVAKFAQDALAYAQDPENGINPTQVVNATTEDDLLINGLKLGYYLVDSSQGSLCALNTTDPNVEITEKNVAPSITKKVQNEDDDWASDNTASIGDTVTFKITITAQKGAENYVLHDVMESGLVFDEVTSVKIANGSSLTVGNDYTVNSAVEHPYEEDGSENCDFDIVFTKAFLDTISEQTSIEVEYTATLSDVEHVVIGAPGNINKARLEYGEVPWIDTDEDNIPDAPDPNGDTPSTPDEETTTYSYEFDLVKTDNAGKVLEGAKFKLYTSENEIVLIEKSDGVYRVATSEEIAAGSIAEHIIAGKVIIQGLGNGDYYLEEIEPPIGYNALKGHVDVKISGSNEKASFDADVYQEGGVQIINNTGSELPSTGGMGTTIFYIVGGVLVLVAVVLLVTRKRMKKEEV